MMTKIWTRREDEEEVERERMWLWLLGVRFHTEILVIWVEDGVPLSLMVSTESKGFSEEENSVEIDAFGRNPSGDVSSASRGSSLSVSVDGRIEEFSVVSTNNGWRTCFL